jgi:uncharacterized membrane protein
MRNEKTNDIVMTAMFVALVMAATYIGIPTPASMGGYMHFGTLVMLAIALKYGPRYGMLSGGIGMTLFDIFSPWAAWALGTFIVRMTMGFVVGYIANDKTKGQGNNIQRNLLAIVMGAIIMISGYFIYQAWMLSTFEGVLSVSDSSAGFDLAMTSIPGNLAQIVVGLFSLKLIKYLPSKESLNIL